LAPSLGAAITQNEGKEEEEDDNIVPIDAETRRKSSRGIGVEGLTGSPWRTSAYLKLGRS
jgi:hypothetical protein